MAIFFSYRLTLVVTALLRRSVALVRRTIVLLVPAVAIAKQ